MHIYDPAVNVAIEKIMEIVSTKIIIGDKKVRIPPYGHCKGYDSISIKPAETVMISLETII